MASVEDTIELRQRRGRMRMRHGHTFPVNRPEPSPQDFTRTSSTENCRDDPESLSKVQQPDDDDNAIESPLLLSRKRAAPDIDSHASNFGIDRTGDRYQSRDSADHPALPNTRLDTRDSEDQQVTDMKIEEANGVPRVPKHLARSGWNRYLHGWIAHIPALLMTVAILVVGSWKFYWYPEQGPLIKDYRVDADTISNVLQLVPKLHELFIVASLSAIALAMFRRSLITDGVHLGFLTGGHRVGDLGYLKTAAFWRQGVDMSNLWGLLLPGFVVFATIMSTIVGPASAVLLVPTLGWYTMNPSDAFSEIELPLIYTRNRANVWYPLQHDAPDTCDGVEGLFQVSCPAGGFPEINSWLQDFAATDLGNNLTFHSTSADLRRHLVFTMANNTQNTSVTTLCTTPPHFLTNSLGLFQKYIDHADVGTLSREPRYRLRTTRKNPTNPSSHEESPLYQPLIQSKCIAYDKEELAQDPSPVVYYPLGSLNCFNDTDCQRVQEDNMPYFNKSNLPHWNKTGHDGSVASTFGLASNSPIVLIAGQIPDASSGKPGYTFYLCNLIASWVPSSFGVDPRVSDASQSSLSNSDIMQNLYHNSTPEDVTNMRFSRQWFQALNPTWDERNRTNITALWRLVQNFSSKENLNGTNQATMSFIERHDGVANYTAAEIFLAKVFGVYLTEGLARSTYQYQTTRLVLNETEDYQLTYINLNEQYGVRGGIHKLTTLNSTFYREDWRGQTIDHEGSLAEFRRKQDAYLRLNIVAERHGYGSGQERRTLQWAQATIGIYLGILAVYASWVGVMAVLDLFRSESSRGRTRALSVIPWSDLQDLIILALRTPVPNEGDFPDAGAGVRSTRVWDKTVKVGLDDNFKAQLVLDEGHSARLEGHPQMR